MVDLVGIGSVISGIGSIFGKKKDKTDYARQTGDSLRGTVTAARELGIHPLAAMGHPMGTPSTVMDTGERLEKAGASMAQAGQGKLAAGIAQSEIALNEAQRKQIEAQTETLKFNTARVLMGGPGSPVNLGSPEDSTATNPWNNYDIDKTAQDAERAETRYAEPGSWLFGLRNMALDARVNLRDYLKAKEKEMSAYGGSVKKLAKGGNDDGSATRSKLEARLKRKLTKDELKRGYIISPGGRKYWIK